METADETSEEKDNSNDNVEKENNNDKVEENSGENLYDDKEQSESDYDKDIEDSRNNDEISETTDTETTDHEIILFRQSHRLQRKLNNVINVEGKQNNVINVGQKKTNDKVKAFRLRLSKQKARRVSKNSPRKKYPKKTH